jgi:hypothetical protein
MTLFEVRNAELVSEFDRYVREHPEFADLIPDHALVALLKETKSLTSGAVKEPGGRPKRDRRLSM